MKILLALLISAVGAFAQADYSTLLLLSNSQTSGTNFTVDVWETFDFTATAGNVTTTLLEANDNYATTGYTFVSDSQTKMSTSTSGEQALINRPGGVTDAGTRGLAIDLTSLSASSYAWFTSPSDTNTVSVGFWFKTATITDTRTYELALFQNSGSDFCMSLNFRNDAGTYKLRQTTSDGNSDVNVSADTWYWLTAQYVRNGTCSFSVYTTAGSLVSAVTKTDSNNRVFSRIRFGISSAPAATDSVTLYYDDLLIVWNGALFPLGP